MVKEGHTPYFFYQVLHSLHLFGRMGEKIHDASVVVDSLKGSQADRVVATPPPSHCEHLGYGSYSGGIRRNPADDGG